MTPSEIITSISLLVASLAALIKAVTGLIKEMRRKPKRKSEKGFRPDLGGAEPHISDYAMEHHENGIDSQRGIRARNGGQRMVRLAVRAHRRMRHRQRRLRTHRWKEGLTCPLNI